MMKNVLRLLVCVLGLTLLSSPAFAQALPWEGRGFITVNYGLQSGSNDVVTSTQTFTVYDETGKVTSALGLESQSPFFDVGAGFRLGGNFGLGFLYSRVSSTGDAAVAAEVPSPLVYDQPRKVTSTATGLQHLEQGYHFQVLWLLPITDKFDITFSAGPSVFSLKQGSVGAPTITEVGPPYTSVNMTTQVLETSATRVGFNVGADLAYRFTNALGIGVEARYAAASFDLEPEPNSTLSVNAGGFMFGGGLRIRF